MCTIYLKKKCSMIWSHYTLFNCCLFQYIQRRMTEKEKRKIPWVRHSSCFKKWKKISGLWYDMNCYLKIYFQLLHLKNRIQCITDIYISIYKTKKVVRYSGYRSYYDSPFLDLLKPIKANLCFPSCNQPRIQWRV